ncbi:hypothetical protein PCAR4_300035 [Paraburkholderia caribensis]|nr:hypothetical protein PCAR4_300035 [Paraburkholderia caribensis]
MIRSLKSTARIGAPPQRVRTNLHSSGIVPEPVVNRFDAGSFSDPGLADRILTCSVAVFDTLRLLDEATWHQRRPD